MSPSSTRAEPQRATARQLSTFAYTKADEEISRSFELMRRSASINEIVIEEFSCALSHYPEWDNITFSIVRWPDHVVMYLDGQEWSNVST